MPLDRILFVSNESYFFVSHRLRLAQVLLDAGAEVHVAAPADHVWAPRDFDVSWFAEIGIHFHPIPLSRRGNNLFYDARTLIALYKLYKRVRPDLVQHITVKPNLYGGIAARLASVPVSISLVSGLGHLFVAQDTKSLVLRKIVKVGYRIISGHPHSAIITQNCGDQKVVQGFVRDPSVVFLVPGAGVPLDVFQPTKEPPCPPVVVILPARLLWEKGIGQFVDAARIVRTKRVNVRFALVGDTQPSNPRSVPREQLDAWSSEGIVEWWGRRDDMSKVFSQCHVVCLPSTYGEGVPRVLIEAAASGRPIVATDTPGCKEIARTGENALLVPPNDVAALADALLELIANPELRQQLGHAGRMIAEQEFSEDSIAAQMQQIYEDISGCHLPKVEPETTVS